mmetsp:Transcript_40241/g.131493  ORF Transcript_40241/g.131493 Transcript_40241/m.131493 type:complete len:313 (+) Transcript_40241:135-1073(+)
MLFQRLLPPGARSDSGDGKIEIDGATSSNEPPQRFAGLGGALVAACLAAVQSIACAKVMAGPLPGEAVAVAMALCLLSSCALQLLLCWLSRLALVACADSFAAALFSPLAARLLAADCPSPLGHLFVSLATFQLVTAAVYLASATLRGGRIVRHLPEPVSLGYLASVGLILVDSSSKVVGCSLLDPLSVWRAPAAARAQLALGTALGVLLTVAGRRLVGSARVALVPATAALAAAVLLLLPLASVDVDGWALDVPAVRLSSLPAALSLGEVRLASAARDGAVTAAVAALPMVAGRMMAYSAMRRRAHLILCR